MRAMILAVLVLVTLCIRVQCLDTLTASLPTLREIWRADNKGYGLDLAKPGVTAATWLKDIVGEGGLVLHVRDSVVTWRMKHAFDTANVFTWTGGNSEIVVGDLNADGIDDFVDGVSNIYLGSSKSGLPILQGDLPNVRRVRPTVIYDVNHDGYDDILYIADSIAVLFGAKQYSEMSYMRMPVTGLSPGNFVASYISKGSLRVITRNREYSTFSSYPYRRVIKEGFCIGSLEFDDQFQNANFIRLYCNQYETPDSTGVVLSSVIHNALEAQYLVAVASRQGSMVHESCQVWALAGDSLRMVCNPELDGIGYVRSLGWSLDDDSLAELLVVRQSLDISDSCQVFTVNGNLESGFKPQAVYESKIPGAIAAFPGASGPHNGNLLLFGKIGAYTFRVLSETGINSGVELQPLDDDLGDVWSNSSDQNIRIRLCSECHLPSNSSVSIYTTDGRLLCSEIKPKEISDGTSQELRLSLPQLPVGLYQIVLSNTSTGFLTKRLLVTD